MPQCLRLHWLRLTATLLVCHFTLAACSTKQVYPGARLAPAEVATIHAYHPIGNVSADILGIDGKWAGISNGSFELLPGVHEFEVSCMFGSDDEECPEGRVTTELQAGRHYQVIPIRQAASSDWFSRDECQVEVIELPGPPHTRMVFGF